MLTVAKLHLRFFRKGVNPGTPLEIALGDWAIDWVNFATFTNE
jgi:hypothetical protein